MYMQARYYDPVIGRFYSNDPVGYTDANPVHSFNRYMYVNNNPYKYVDPNGKFLKKYHPKYSINLKKYLSQNLREKEKKKEKITMGKMIVILAEMKMFLMEINETLNRFKKKLTV